MNAKRHIGKQKHLGGEDRKKTRFLHKIGKHTGQREIFRKWKHFTKTLLNVCIFHIVCCHRVEMSQQGPRHSVTPHGMNGDSSGSHYMAPLDSMAIWYTDVIETRCADPHSRPQMSYNTKVGDKQWSLGKIRKWLPPITKRWTEKLLLK